jgi:hypothetical protein
MVLFFVSVSTSFIITIPLLSPHEPQTKSIKNQKTNTQEPPLKTSTTYQPIKMPFARILGAAKPIGKLIAWTPIAIGAHFFPMYVVCKSGFFSEEQIKRALKDGQGKPQHRH